MLCSFAPTSSALSLLHPCVMSLCASFVPFHPLHPHTPSLVPFTLCAHVLHPFILCTLVPMYWALSPFVPLHPCLVSCTPCALHSLQSCALHSLYLVPLCSSHPSHHLKHYCIDVTSVKVKSQMMTFSNCMSIYTLSGCKGCEGNLNYFFGSPPPVSTKGSITTVLRCLHHLQVEHHPYTFTEWQMVGGWEGRSAEQQEGGQEGGRAEVWERAAVQEGRREGGWVQGHKGCKGTTGVRGARA